MKKLIIISLFILANCSTITKPNTNYVRTGMLKDRYTALHYHYVEAGKSLELNEYNSINTYVGMQDKGSDELFEKSGLIPYWEVNYQVTF